MICKNEAARIVRCLNSVAPWISSYAIFDTGSSDGTPGLIRDFMGAHGIKGTVMHGSFVDFSTSRNDALMLGRQMECDYLLLVDADMELRVDTGRNWLDDLGDFDCYRVLQRNGSLSYLNARLLRCGVEARYVGVTHEYLDLRGTIGELDGVWFLDHGDGANREGKFERDIRLLEEDLERDPDNGRSIFYLAQSYRELGNHTKAAELYAKRAAMGGWEEEGWRASLEHARALFASGDKSGTHVLLSTYNRRPGRVEPLYDLARYYREQGQPHASLLFSGPGLGIRQPPAGDMLFLEEDAYSWGVRQEFAIEAFYDSEQRFRGRWECDQLALDRSVPLAQREIARRNLYFYTQPIGELIPSWHTRRLDFVPPAGYRQMSPSVTRLGDQLVMAVRTVNYWLDEHGRYCTPGGSPGSPIGAPVHSRTFLVEIDPMTLADTEGPEITLPSKWPKPLYEWVLGFEDMRIFEFQGVLCGVFTVREQNVDGLAEQWFGLITSVAEAGVAELNINSTAQINEAQAIRPEGVERRCEKNWVPLVDGRDLKFVYLCDPTRIIDRFGKTLCESTPAIAADDFRGGSQAIPFDGGWLAIVHTVVTWDYRKYGHRFVWFDKAFRLHSTSLQFAFPSDATPDLLRGYQYVIGLCWHPDGERLVMGYQKDERESWVGTMNADDVRRLLRPGIPEGEPMSSARHSESSAPKDPWRKHESWFVDNTNCALQTSADVDVATARLLERGLPEHEDRVKNWDTTVAIWHVLQNTGPSDAILDAGGTRTSAFLPGLAKLGYTDLTNWNLDLHAAGAPGGIKWRIQDITRSDAPDDKFSFVACLSVIEHGVDVLKFFAEMSRIIRPGGFLFLSFDYWQDPIDCGDRVAFGVPVRIFTRREGYMMCAAARSVGLDIDHSDLSCRDRVCSWFGLDFTFANLLFRRE